ncbi:putative glutathione synthetase, partial [Trypanosoma grayi]|uniref:putative glutathione synthetase n=1 Tax=Trypanosoma grayi TaxID=71804 RepID=UPI0004F44CDF
MWQQQQECVEHLVAKCIALGLTMRRSSQDVTHPAVTLQPMIMRRDEFDALCEQQLLWNEAVDNTARNFTFLYDALRETAASDTEFTGRLVEMLQTVYLGDSPYQSLMLGIFRTDYMRSGAEAKDTSDAEAWKNVEINTISCSFAGLAPLVNDFHRHLEAYSRAMQNPEASSSTKDAANQAGVLERSKSAKVVPEALAAAVVAWTQQQQFDELRETYARQQQQQLLQPIVLVIVQENERNTGDQYALLFELLETHGILALRRTLQELHTCMQLHPVPNGAPLAVVDKSYPVAVAYFRSTYVPADFPTEEAWAARLQVERSSAVKCPSVPYHLLTFKKLQQLFCDVDNILAPVAFRGDTAKARLLQRHFMPQYALNPAEVGEATVARVIEDALQNPQRYVLKPQLEGGSNLLSGAAMVAALQITEAEDPVAYSRIRREYILMSRIDFQVRSGAFLVHGKVVQLKHNLCSELGIYGVILSDGKSSSSNTLRNACAGYTVRSKPADVDDGGVMAGG